MHMKPPNDTSIIIVVYLKAELYMHLLRIVAKVLLISINDIFFCIFTIRVNHIKIVFS